MSCSLASPQRTIRAPEPIKPSARSNCWLRQTPRRATPSNQECARPAGVRTRCFPAIPPAASTLLIATAELTDVMCSGRHLELGCRRDAGFATTELRLAAAVGRWQGADGGRSADAKATSASTRIQVELPSLLQRELQSVSSRCQRGMGRRVGCAVALVLTASVSASHACEG